MYYKRDLHIGKIIKEVFSNSGLTITQFARLLNYQRANVYDIFNRESIDIETLIRISRILNHDFLGEYYAEESQPRPQATKVTLTLSFDYDGISCQNIQIDSINIRENREDKE